MVDELRTDGLQHPLDAMLEAGRITVEVMAQRMSAPGSDPVLRRATPTEMRSRLAAAAPEEPTDFARVLADVVDNVLPFASRTDHPGYFAFIPSFTTWPAVMAELVAAAANPYCGAWMESAGPAQVELDVLGWFRDWLGMPDTTSGILVSGGSAANLSALMLARETSPVALCDAVLYLSDQAHSSIARTARVLGFDATQVRVLPTDHNHRLDIERLRTAFAVDRAGGRSPLAVCASAGSTNAGVVDPLSELADVCESEGVWLHVDAAYGGFAAQTARGRALLSGIERANSVTLDPHKWLFQPMECGGLLVRDGHLLTQTFGVHADYLAEARTNDEHEVDFSDRGLQLSRGFRALKVWMSVQTFGLSAFRSTIDRCLDRAALAEEHIVASEGLELMSPAQLGIVCFRRTWDGIDEEEIVRRNLALVESLERSGRALVSTTRLHGRFAVRLCILNPTSGLDDVLAALDYFALSPEADSGPPAPVVAAGLFEDLDPETLAWVAATGSAVDLPAGEVLISQWATDRMFYVVIAGSVEVTIDGRIVRTLGANDFFGELAAQDWGAGYGYGRLATVTATSAVRLFVLPAGGLDELVRRSPQVQQRIESATRDRLREL